MTQLNLSGRQPTNPQQKSAAEPEGGSIKNQTVGALGALAMFAAVIVIGSCSRSSTPAAVQQPIQPAAPVSAVAVTAPVPAPVPVPAKARSKTKTRRAATLSYVNREYGFSFRFPRNYQLKTSDEVRATLDTMQPFQMNFVHPGGVTLAAVELPGNSYPGTDFKSGFVTVSVNPGMTSEACAQFAFPEPSTGADASSQEKSGQEKSGQVKMGQGKIGAMEFHEVEDPGGATTNPADAKYYHVFQNGACYEFALGIGTDSDSNVEEITPVDREQVFRKLEKILATVRLQPAVMPETGPAVPAVSATAPVDSSKPAEQGAAAPNF
ncbi:MAG: hypothetical protein ACRD23_03535 [Terriglobales bacterium]